MALLIRHLPVKIDRLSSDAQNPCENRLHVSLISATLLRDVRWSQENLQKLAGQLVWQRLQGMSWRIQPQTWW